MATQPGGAANVQIGTPLDAAQHRATAAQQQEKPAAAQGPLTPLEDVEKQLGPYTLAPGQDFFVIIHFKRVRQRTAKVDDAAAWLEIRNATGAVQYHEDYPYTVGDSGRGAWFDDECSATANLLAGSNGKGIMIDSECEPSAPLSGGSSQILGIVKGKLVPFGKPLYVEGDIERFVPGAVTKQGQLTIISADMLVFKIFTGNVFVELPVRVNWIEGKLELGMHCYEQSGHGAVESGCEVPVVEVQRLPIEQEMTFVRMFPEANENMHPAHVVIRKNSRIEVLAARVQASLGEDKNSMSLGVNDDVWLKVRLDGKEGWIHTQEDFQAIGLPQAG